jgi:hypothetical protein
VGGVYWKGLRNQYNEEAAVVAFKQGHNINSYLLAGPKFYVEIFVEERPLRQDVWWDYLRAVSAIIAVVKDCII